MRKCITGSDHNVAKKGPRCGGVLIAIVFPDMPTTYPRVHHIMVTVEFNKFDLGSNLEVLD